MKKIHSPIAAKPSTRIGRAIAILCARRVLSNRKEVPLLFLWCWKLGDPLNRRHLPKGAMQCRLGSASALGPEAETPVVPYLFLALKFSSIATYAQ
jgi:hypothetical protein